LRDAEQPEDAGSRHARERQPNFANVRFSHVGVVADLRGQFLREVETTAPEVLERLRDNVWPEYAKAYHASVHSGENILSVLNRSRWSQSLQVVVIEWIHEFRLLHGRNPPEWILSQMESTLSTWTRHPSLVSGAPGWVWLGGQTMERTPSPEDFVISLGTYKWDWRHGRESADEARNLILKEIRDIVNRRFVEMLALITLLPRAPNKRRPEHFTWLVQHQIQRMTFQDIADRSHVEPITVKNEVTDLKKLIGLSLQRGRPRGRK
jgi:hypothetical protein